MKTALAAVAFAFVTLATVAAASQQRTPAQLRSMYLLYCSGCHGADGMGYAHADVPPMPGFIGSVLSDREGRRYVVNVGGLSSANLNDEDTAQVLNWIIDNFAAAADADGLRRFDAREVRELRARRPADSVALRREIAGRLKQQGIVEPEGYPWP